MKLIKYLFGTLSQTSPKLASRIAFWLFQRTPKKKNRFRKRELGFYAKATSFRVNHQREDLHCYEMGKPSNKMAILVHGWESNAGSLMHVAELMLKKDYYVIAIDLPGHGNSALSSTNLIECSDALKTFFSRIRPDSNAVLVSHSFGSAAAAHALSSSFHLIGRWVMLTSPNKIEDIFLDYQDLIGINQRSYELLIDKAESILGEKIEKVSVEERLSEVSCESFLLIHDTNDKVIPVEYSRKINSKRSNSRLVEFTDVGHYRMLSNPKVLEEIEAFLSADAILSEVDSNAVSYILN